MARPSIYKSAGGRSAFLALARRHHERCLQDPVLNHPFSHPGHSDHVERLANYWAEVLGGPPLHSEVSDGQPGMLRLHAGMQADDDLGARFVACFTRAIEDADLPADPELRRALRAYMEWATGDVHVYNPKGSIVPADLPVPRWGWDGLEGGPGALMGRRIRWLGVFMVVCLGLIVAQLVNIQFVKAHQLADSPNNPRVAALRYENVWFIYAADGTTVLAKSVRTTPGKDKYPYSYLREYPEGPLYAGITGYDSALYYGTSGIEEEYNSELSAHSQGVQNLSQLIFGEKTPSVTDDVTLTVQPSLQQAAWNALTTLPPGVYKDGAVVVLKPSTGDVEAMVSNPTFDPNALVGPSLSAEQLAYFSYNNKDHEGFFPLQPIATGYRFAPGSTFKVVTSTAAYNLVPALANFDYPVMQCQKFPDSNVPLCDQGGPCGGTMVSMLPASCDPGYGELGVQEGVAALKQQADLFGFDSTPGIDLPNVVQSVFPPLPDNSQALLADSAIGQYDVAATALQDAMVASGIADGGIVMTPHLMSEIRDSQGNVVETYAPKALPRTATQEAATEVTALMEGVVKHGTASGVGFPSYLCAAVKTGTAQTSPSQHVTETWMIGFAPANNPQVAVAVVVPEQSIASDGASVAGPIMKAILEAAVPQGSISPNCTVPQPQTQPSTQGQTTQTTQTVTTQETQTTQTVTTQETQTTQP